MANFPLRRVVAVIAALLILLLAQRPPKARAQGRQSQPQTPTPAATTTPTAQPQTTPGGRGRGGIAGPGPAVGGEVDETPVVTHHSVTVDGKALNYTATVAQMPLKNPAGETVSASLMFQA